MLRLPPNPLPLGVLQKIDENYRLRWRTLMSVDDMVSGVIRALNQMGLLEETYILVTSDNGYHLGQVWASRLVEPPGVFGPTRPLL